MSNPFSEPTQHVVRAIQTSYKGYKFRSRLEARWAVFFDKCGVDFEWQYELEGFDLPSGWYLPDFLIWGSMWVEIKPRSLSDDDFKETVVKLTELGDMTNKAAVLFVGDPVDFIGGDAVLERGYIADQTDFKPRFAYRPHSMPVSTDTDIFGMIDLLTFAHEYGLDPVSAAVEARSARFEHGETP